MRFDHEGRSLWYGTPDAPAPAETISAGTEATITIGVSPVDASNKVDLLYRINQGPVEMVAARWVRNDPSQKAQYFRATLPAIRAGDIAEYLPINGCAGCQVPSPAERAQFPSSFRVIEATAPSSAALTLNRSILARNIPNLSSARVESVSSAPPLSSVIVTSTGSPSIAAHVDLPESVTLDRPFVPINPAATGAPTVGPQTEPPRSVSPSSPFIPANPAAPGGPPIGPASGPRSLTGRILLDHGIPGAGVTLRVYNRGFGGDSQVGAVQTDANGDYVLAYDPGSAPANLEVRTVDAEGKEISLSNTKFNAGVNEVLNLVAPANVTRSLPEFNLLCNALGGGKYPALPLWPKQRKEVSTKT